MTKIQIRKVNGVPMGRPVNEHIYSKQWQEFERTVTEHEAPGFEEGEAEGVLVTQKREKDNPLQKEFRDCGSDESVRYPWCEYRQIWIVPTPEKVEVKEVDNWIRVEDRLPEESGDYIIYGRFTKDCHRSVNQAHYIKKQKRFQTIGIYAKDVTHWQPLPSSPTTIERIAKEALKDK